MASPRIRKAPTMAEINAQTAALNKKLGTVAPPAAPKTAPSLPNTKTQLRPKPSLKQQAQAAFQGVRSDVQETRRKNIDAAVEGRKPYNKRK
jgi:hypothetical protein